MPGALLGLTAGVLGSRAYIEQHLASRPLPPGLTGIEAQLKSQACSMLILLSRSASQIEK